MTKIAVFVSGNGSNLQALLDAEKSNELSGGEISLVFSDKKEAFALKRAKDAGVETFLLEREKFDSVQEYEQGIIDKLREKKIGLIALAGFMRILSGHFIKAFKWQIINIHPALLPSFKGAHGIRDAFKAGVKLTGVTVHFVTEEMDSGPIISQEPVRIEEDETLQSLEIKIHKVEHKVYKEAVQLFCEGRLKLEGNKVRII